MGFGLDSINIRIGGCGGYGYCIHRDYLFQKREVFELSL